MVAVAAFPNYSVHKRRRFPHLILFALDKLDTFPNHADLCGAKILNAGRKLNRQCYQDDCNDSALEKSAASVAAASCLSGAKAGGGHIRSSTHNSLIATWERPSHG